MKRQVAAIAILALAVVLFFVSRPVRAQQATTSLRGTVTDPGGNLIAGALITITRADTGQVLTTTTKCVGRIPVSATGPRHMDGQGERHWFWRSEQSRESSGQQTGHH
jgi:hypothetical protein